MEFKDKKVELLNKNTIRIYKKKNDTSLFGLNDVKREIDSADLPEISCREDGSLVIRRNGTPVFEEKACKNIETKKEENFDIALKEGHKTEAKDHSFKTLIGVALSCKDDKIYGLGDKAAFLNRRGYAYVSKNSDDPTQHNETYRSLYKSVNFILVKQGESQFGLFYPSSYECTFDLGKTYDDRLFIGSEKGEYDYFLFIGKNPAEIVKAYYSLIGPSVFTTMKFMGNHQSRWSYTDDEAKELVRRHTEEGLPLDYIHFDIDYMNGYRVYTVDDAYVPDFAETCRKFKEQGVAVITIIDPAVKKDEGYKIYDDVKKMNGFATLNGKEYVNEVWPGDAVYPDYFKKNVRDYFKNVTKEFLRKYNVTGIWGDMNEPASFRGPLPDDVEFMGDDRMILHDEAHNLYAEYMSKTIAEAFREENKRPTLITRAAFAATSRYTTSWNGDNQSLWDHLRTSLPQVMTMNLCGFFMNGVDVGGFGNDTTKELLLRWAEADLFMPYFRNHSAKGTRKQEPYAFDKETYEIYKKILKIRYRFIPYLYTLQWQAHETGMPMFAPLFMYRPEDEKVWEINDEVMVGDRVLHAPIVDQGKRERIVYFPKGSWIDFFTGKLYEGGRAYIIEMPLDSTGIFIKEGAVIPMVKDLTSIEPEKIREIEVYLAREKNGRDSDCLPFDLHVDDGESLDYEKGIYDTVRISVENGKIKTEKRKFDFGKELNFVLA
ncbi:MAG: alpha-glucosidase [Lachnospiraceae bacterium]|nr:alpha-glucosidase [Lachnospiraceae bacterium]